MIRRSLQVAGLCLAVFLFVSACSDKGDLIDQGYFAKEEVRPLRLRFSESYALIDDGLFYVKDDHLLSFYDHKEDTSVIVCNRADCRHTVADDCAAALRGLQTVFIAGERLFTVEHAPDSDANAMVLTVVRSNLDRSAQSTLIKMPDATIASLLLNETTLFGILTYVEIEESDTIGQPDMPTGRASHVLFSLALESGVYRELVAFDWLHASKLQLAGLTGSKLYLVHQDAMKKTYASGYFDYSAAAQAYYRGQVAYVDLGSDALTVVYLDTESVPWLTLALLKDDSLYFYEQRDPADYGGVRDLKRLDLLSGQIETILVPDDDLRQWGDDFFFFENENAYHFNLSTGEKHLIEDAMFAPYSFIEFDALGTIMAMKKVDDERQWEPVKLDHQSFIGGAFDRFANRYEFEVPVND